MVFFSKTGQNKTKQGGGKWVNFRCYNRRNDIAFTEPDTVSIQSDKQALHDNENTTLTCVFDGGYPTHH